MMRRHGGLGRGLAALIPHAPIRDPEEDAKDLEGNGDGATINLSDASREAAIDGAMEGPSNPDALGDETAATSRGLSRDGATASEIDGAMSAEPSTNGTDATCEPSTNGTVATSGNSLAEPFARGNVTGEPAILSGHEGEPSVIADHWSGLSEGGSPEQTSRRSGGAGTGDEDSGNGTSPAGSAERAGGAEASGATASLLDLEVDLIDPNPRQPRSAFDADAQDELRASVAAVGVLQPIVVRPSGARYEVVMGERRLRAAKAASLATVPAVVRETEDAHLLRDALMENIHRRDLNPLEEAAAYEQLLGDFGVTHDELAERLGRSRPAISNAVRLLRLPPNVQRRIAAGILTAGHARAVASLRSPKEQEQLADRIVAEGLTVRMAEELARRVALGEPALGRRHIAPSARAASTSNEAVDHLAEQLSERLSTRVRIQLGKRKGRMLIEFATLDDLDRICNEIGASAAAK